MAMKCVQLCAEWRELSLEGDGEIIIEEVSMDSRHCGPGVLFVAVTGSLVDGHDYVAAAVAAVAGYAMARARLLARRYRKRLAGLEAEVHQLRNLPLAGDETARGENALDASG